MTTTLEALPDTWDDARDTAFFRVTCQLFPSSFLYGAGVLLASYDEDVHASLTIAATPADEPVLSRPIATAHAL